LLAELNIKPRTYYLARIRNPHPALAEKRQDTTVIRTMGTNTGTRDIP
jgi:hypothetical protein